MKRSIFAVVIAGLIIGTAMPAHADGPYLSGTVVNVSLNTPVAGVKVRAFLMGSDRLQDSAVTDTQGEFTLVHVRPGTYRLAFDASGYHESLIGDVRIRSSDDNIHLSAPVALYPSSMDIPLQAALADPCRDLVQPGQTSSVYVICANH